jgi:hypothetical protein
VNICLFALISAFLRVLIIAESEYIELEKYSKTREYTPFREDFGGFEDVHIYMGITVQIVYCIFTMYVCVCVLVHSLGSHQSIVK